MTVFLSILFTLVSLLLILIVLIQRGRGGGLSGAFGMGGGGQTAFGTKTGDILTTVTVCLFAVFMLMAIGLGLMIKNSADNAAIAGAIKAPTSQEAPVVPAAPAASAPATQAK